MADCGGVDVIHTQGADDGPAIALSKSAEHRAGSVNLNLH